MVRIVPHFMEEGKPHVLVMPINRQSGYTPPCYYLIQQKEPNGSFIGLVAEGMPQVASCPGAACGPILCYYWRMKPASSETDAGAGGGLARFARAGWPAKAVGLGLTAFALGDVGEALLFYPGGRALGAGLLAAAMFLGAIAWGGLPTGTPRAQALSEQAPATSLWNRATALRVAGIAGALLLLLGSILAWLADPAAIFGWQGVLWLGSIALLVASCARWQPRGTSREAAGPAWTRREIALFVGILALALFTHLAWLNDIPWRFQLDETVAYKEALRFYRGPAISVFTTTWYDTGLPSLFFVFAGASLNVTGISLGGVRAAVALVGALTTIPVYGLGRLLAGRVGAALAAFSTATTAVIVHYSRVSIINMTTPFAWAVCFYFLLRGYRTRKPADFTWAGIAGGLSMYTYYGARLLPYLLAVIAIYLLLFHRRAFKERLGELALMPIGFLVGFGPLLAYFIRNPEVWAGRGLSQLNVPATIPTSLQGWLSDWNTLAPLMWQNFLGLSVLRNNDSFFWAPLLLPVEAVLALLGVGILIRSWQRVEAFVVLLWGLSVFFVGGVLIGDVHVPAFVHLTPAFPFLSLSMALAPALWLDSLRKLGARWWRAGCWAVGLGALALGAANAYFYLVAYPPTVPPSFESAQGRFLASLENDPQRTPVRVRFVGDSWKIFSPEVGALLAPNIPASDFLNPSRELPLVSDGKRDEVFIFNEDEVQYLPVIEEYYPGGQVAPLQTPGGPIGESYRISAAQESARHGVLLTIRQADAQGKAEWQGNVPTVGAWPAGVALSYPALAAWSGQFYLQQAGSVGFQAVGGSEATLEVEAQPVEQGVPLPLEGGWVPFSLRAQLSGPVTARLLIQEGDGASIEPDTESLWPESPNQGLALTYTGATTERRIVPFPGASILSAKGGTFGGFLNPPTQRDPDFVPLASANWGLARWQGQVYSDGGSYKIEVRTDSRVVMAIDGRVALNLCSNGPLSMQDRYRGAFEGGVTIVTLTRGWHTIEFDQQATGDANGLEWTWTRPDGVREIVPPSRLRYAGSPFAEPQAPVAFPCPK